MCSNSEIEPVTNFKRWLGWMWIRYDNGYDLYGAGLLSVELVQALRLAGRCREGLAGMALRQCNAMHCITKAGLFFCGMAWDGEWYYDRVGIFPRRSRVFERLLRFGLGRVDSDLGYEHGHCVLLVFTA